MTAEQWIALGSVAAAAVAVIAVVASIIAVRDQLRTFVFIEYTDRFTKTMAKLPSAARRPGSPYALKKLPEDDRLAVLAVFRDYFNMCSEELWLHSVGRIDKATWRIWRDGIKESARTPAFGEAWEDLRDEYHYYPKFTRFIDDLIGGVAKDEKLQLPPQHQAESAAE